MIEGQNIICFCNDWDGDPLSKKQIALRLAKRNRILWVNSMGGRNPTLSSHDIGRAWKKLRQFAQGCRQVADSIFLFSPLVIPFHASPLARWLNRRLLFWSLWRVCRKLGFHNPITLTFVPNSVDVAGTLGEKLVIYYCVDEYSEFTGTNKQSMRDMERRLIEKSDFVVVSADRLLQTKRPHNPNTFLIPHGVDVDHFRKACSPDTTVPADVPRNTAAVIGFYGLMEDWVDYSVIRYLAIARPEWSFVVVGEVRTDLSSIEHLPNVYILGRRPYTALPGYCKSFDVAILPFVVNELTQAANPLKLREYLAAGLPVVATPLPEVRKLEGKIRLASTPQEYLTQIEALLAAGDRGPRLHVSQGMDHESWEERVERLSALVERFSRKRKLLAEATAA